MEWNGGGFSFLPFERGWLRFFQLQSIFSSYGVKIFNILHFCCCQIKMGTYWKQSSTKIERNTSIFTASPKIVSNYLDYFSKNDLLYCIRRCLPSYLFYVGILNLFWCIVLMVVLFRYLKNSNFLSFSCCQHESCTWKWNGIDYTTRSRLQ